MEHEKKILYPVSAPDKPECPVDGLGRHPDFMFWCPGCKNGHGVWTTQKNGQGAIWTFNGNMEKPTFSPSLLVRFTRDITDDEHRRIMAGEKLNIPKSVCHSVITDGVINYCGDCTHDLAGKAIPMEAF